MTGQPHLVFPKYNALILFCSCYHYGHSLFSKSRCDSPFLDRPIDKVSAYADRNKRELEIVLAVQRARGWSASVLWRCEAFDDAGAPTWHSEVRPDLGARISRLVRNGVLSPPRPVSDLGPGWLRASRAQEIEQALLGQPRPALQRSTRPWCPAFATASAMLLTRTTRSAPNSMSVARRDVGTMRSKVSGVIVPTR